MSFMGGLAGQKLKVTLELPTGEVLSGTALAAQLDQRVEPIDVTHLGDKYRSFISGFETWSLTLEGTGTPVWMGTRSQAIERQHEQRSAIEWECDYCGSVWPKAATKCIQCGGHRSFLYDV